MQEVVLANAISRFTDFARKHAHRKAFADKRYPTGVEVEAARTAVNSVCDEMDGLVKNPKSSFSDFELLREKMGRAFPPLHLDFITVIADAFDSAGRLSGQAKKAGAGVRFKVERAKRSTPAANHAVLNVLGPPERATPVRP